MSELVSFGLASFGNSQESSYTTSIDPVDVQQFLEALLTMGNKERSGRDDSSLDLTEAEYKDLSKILQYYIIGRLKYISTEKQSKIIHY